MTNDEACREVESVLRWSALAGSDREISPDAPLGEQGLGLDSLALVGFVTALENRFRMEFPDTIWVERDRMTLRRFADIVGEAGSAAAPAIPRPEPVPPEAEGERSLRRKVANRVRERGLFRSLTWAFRKYLVKRETRYILAFDLVNQAIPAYSSALNLTLRECTPDDLAALVEFSSSIAYYTADTNVLATRDIFQERMAAEYLGFAAWHQGKIVGVDWLTDKGYTCPFTGLALTWPRDSCYAMELYEHDAFHGKGIGLALLAFSLVEAKKRGYRRQVTWVRSTNVKMLAAAVQFFSFVKTGQIDTLRFFGMRITKWRNNGKSGRRSLSL